MAGRTNTAPGVSSGRVVALHHPSAGTSETVRLGPGEALDLSAIANENITLLKLDGRLVVLFPDKAHVIVEGLYLPNGQPAPDVSVNLDGATAVAAPLFVSQFPISTDEQIFTAAGLSMPPRAPLGSGGNLFGSGLPFESTSGQALNGLVQQTENTNNDQTGQQGAAFLSSYSSSLAPTVYPAPTAVNNNAAVSEAGVRAPGNVAFAGQPSAAGDVLANDSLTGAASVIGVGVGASASLANVGTALVGTYGTLVLNADGTYTYTIDNNAPNVQALSEGRQVADVFTYEVTDASGLSGTATLTVTLTGTNDLPSLDIDTGAAGTGYQGLTAAEAARSTDTVSAGSGVAIVRPGQVLASDPDGDTFSQVQVSIGATASGQVGKLTLGSDIGESLTFTAGPAGYSAADVQNLLSELRFVNTERTFALDIADRAITIVLTDAFGATTTVTAHVPVIADVRDTTGLNTFTGTRFDDRIEGMGGADTIRAGEGNDTLIYRAGDGADTLLDGGAGTDTLSILGDGADNLFRVTFSGTALERLSSEAAALPASANLAGLETISLAGGLGADTLDYSGTTVAVSADLLAGTASGFSGISEIENLTGGSAADTLSGNGGDNVIEGAEGDNVIDGRGGNNRLTAGGGDNTFTAGAGNDVIAAGDGDNTVNAGDGNNFVVLGDGTNDITTGLGDDTITAGAGDNTIDAGDGNNFVTLGDGANDVTTGIDDDTIVAGDGDNTIKAGAGTNFVTLGDGDSGVITGSGDDTITLGDGDNTVDAGDGNNTLNAGDGDNGITTGVDDDTITVGDGSNIIDAGDGDNIVTAGDGGNVITVGDGDNTLISGLAADTITAGDGDNSVDAGDGNNAITLGAGADDILAGIGNDLIDAGDGDNVIDAGNGQNDVTAGAGDDSITTGSGDDIVHAGDGDNGIITGGGNNTIYAGSGSDTITLSGTTDYVEAGGGDDQITVTGTGTAEIHAGAGDDSILAAIGSDLIFGDDGSDVITTGGGADTVAYQHVGSEGGDTVRDFTTGTDIFQFEALDIGLGLATGGTDTGTLDASRFTTGEAFTNTTQRFLLNTTDQTLYYDADGSGGGSAMIALAHIETGTVAASDIRVT